VRDSLPVSTDATVGRSPGDVCDTWGAGQPLSGILDIESKSDTANTWLLTPEGTRVALRWPSGFTFRPSDKALLDERGSIQFHNRDSVTFSQVSRRDAEGSLADPYVATGIFGTGCWTRR
jgi:hypothetical protein